MDIKKELSDIAVDCEAVAQIDVVSAAERRAWVSIAKRIYAIIDKKETQKRKNTLLQNTLPRYIQRKDDGALLSLNQDGTYSFINQRKTMPTTFYRYNLNVFLREGWQSYNKKPKKWI